MVTANASIVIQESDHHVVFSNGTLLLEATKSYTNNSKTTISVDKDKLEFPLELRLWKKGDIFYPLGMNGKKKVSKYLKDERLTLPEKAHTWVLCSKEKIICILGHRADERFKIQPQTKAILKIKLCPS